MQDTVWVCRDGRRILVSYMTDSHLHNCMAMILRRRNWRREYIDRLLLEVEIRRILKGGLTR
jgi:hypothetical protein